jgi:hypothetical protein
VNFGGENRTVLRRAVICFEALGQRHRALAVLESARGKSPLGRKNVPYRFDEAITADAHADQVRNVYRYNCSFKLNAEDFSSDSGGEIEIITN